MRPNSGTKISQRCPKVQALIITPTLAELLVVVSLGLKVSIILHPHSVREAFDNLHFDTLIPKGRGFLPR